MKQVKILNIAINNLSQNELLRQLEKDGGVVFTPNVDHLMKMQKDQEFYEVYQKSNYRVCDGQILFWMLKLLGKPVKEKISGSRFFPAFYQHHKNKKNTKIFLLGAAPGVAARAQKNINQKVGRNIVIDTYSPSFGFEKDDSECEYILDRINNSGANVLVVGVGAPKQEKWIIKYKKFLTNINIFLAVGASIDFEAGHKSLAPKWISDAGLETPYRLLSEPRRLWKRYLIEHPPFFYFVLQEKLKLYRNPFG
ncbi:exopolysaccharide biosynthesis protein, WecB/TagA/CpsF family [Xenococcus sp. PCC 7305]|uniref:WecB/TagA/CpsF family glycosyltransferase n=1 Tax=Xenococcus sp. PCC 7305 TaxID=102125 RepID=UPI0002AC1F13|nr:WecB/TagA/CpsF family glycosyltransferase [Xenococcus sp. PCC 7305]ELS02851.1 exopolysaccharide biosynthesis protein, WecB/TagA/CpsF family [Xenococcus sp. PCC 7305]